MTDEQKQAWSAARSRHGVALVDMVKFMHKRGYSDRTLASTNGEWFSLVMNMVPSEFENYDELCKAIKAAAAPPLYF